MQHSLAAIRRGRIPTRFTVPSSRQRLPRLGLCRPTFAPAAQGRRAPAARARDELRRAARSCVTARKMPAGPSVRHGLHRRADALSWSGRLEGRLRQPRPRSAAPWRG